MPEPSTVAIDTVDLKILLLIEKNLTYAEMAAELGYSAKSGIHRRVDSLIEDGLVTKEPLKSRSRRLTENGRDLIKQLVDTYGEEQTSGP